MNSALPKPAAESAPTFDAKLYAETIASVAKMAVACGVPPDFRRMWFDAEIDLIRLRAIEAAACEVLARGQAVYRGEIGGWGDAVHEADLVPAAAMTALRSAVEVA